MTTISDTDLQVFANLVNPTKANIPDLKNQDYDVKSDIEKIEELDDSDNENDEASDIAKSNNDSASDHLSEKSESDQEDRIPSPQKSSFSNHSNKPPTIFSQTQRSIHSNHNSSDSNKESDDESIENNHPPSHVSRKSAASSVKSAGSTHFTQNTTKGESPPKKKNHNYLPVMTASYDDPNMEILEKQQILMDMERLKLQGIKLTKEWTTNDRLDDMQFEVRRHMLHIDEMNNINMMRDGMRLMCSGFEMLNTRMGFLELDGWAQEVCSDMDKYDNALGRIYRKYWRRSTQNSPEMEIAMGLVGSMGMYHFKKKMQNNMFGGGGGMNKRPPNTGNSMGRPPPPTKTNTQNTSHISEESSSDEEDGPP